MTERKLPSKLVFDKGDAIQLLPLVAFFPLVITLAIFIGLVVTENASLDVWQIPLIGITTISLLAFVTGVVLNAGMNLWETNRIKQVYAEAWLSWEQYNSDEQWQKFLEKEYQTASKNLNFEFAPIIIVGVIVSIIGGAAYFNEVDVSIIFGLAGFMLVVIGIVVGRWLYQKWGINATYKRRKQSSIPAILISHDGYYNEDTGFATLRRLKSVELKTSSGKKSAKIKFVTEVHWLERWFVADEHSHLDTRFRTLSVDVPKDKIEEAEALVRRFETEVLS